MGKQGPCNHCGIAYTPLWRNGPPEKPVLCNACGSRWRTRGTLENYMPLHAGGLGLNQPAPGGSKSRAAGQGRGGAGRSSNKAAPASAGSPPAPLPTAASTKQSTRPRIPGRRRGSPGGARPGVLRLGGSKGIRTLRPGPYQRALPLSAAVSSSSAGRSPGRAQGERRGAWQRRAQAGGGRGGAGLLWDEDESAEGEDEEGAGEDDSFDDVMEDAEEGEDAEGETEEEEGDEEEGVGNKEAISQGHAGGQRHAPTSKAHVLSALRPEAGSRSLGLQGARPARRRLAARGPGKGIRGVRGQRVGAGGAWGQASGAGRGAGLWGLGEGAAELETDVDLDMDLGLGLGLEAADMDPVADWDALLGEMQIPVGAGHEGGKEEEDEEEDDEEEEGEEVEDEDEDEEGEEEEAEGEEEEEVRDGEDEEGSEGEEVGAGGQGGEAGRVQLEGVESAEDHAGACRHACQGTRGLATGAASGLARAPGVVWARSMSEADLPSLATAAWGRSSLLASLAQGAEATGTGKVRRRGLPPAPLPEDRACAVGGAGGSQGPSSASALARGHGPFAGSCCSPLRARGEHGLGEGPHSRGLQGGPQGPGLVAAEAVGCSSSAHLRPAGQGRHLPGLPCKLPLQVEEGADGVHASAGAAHADEELLAQEGLAALPSHGRHSVRCVWRAGGEWWGGEGGGSVGRSEAEELGSELGSDEDQAVGLLVSGGHSQHRRRSRQLWEGEVAGSSGGGKGLPRAASAGDLCLPSILSCSTGSRAAAPSLGSSSSSTLSVLEHARKRGRLAPGQGQGPGPGPRSPPSCGAEGSCAGCNSAGDAPPGGSWPGCPSCSSAPTEDEQGRAAQALGGPARRGGVGQTSAVAGKAERPTALHSSSSSCGSNVTDNRSLDCDVKPALNVSAGAKGVETGRMSSSSSSSSAAHSIHPLANASMKKDKPHYNPRTVLKGVKSPLTRLNLKNIVNARVLSTLLTSREDRALLCALLPAPDQASLQGLEQGPRPGQGEVAAPGKEPQGHEAARWHALLGSPQMDAALVGFQRLLARGALDPALFHPALAAPLALLTTDASLRAPALVAALDKLSQAGVVLRRRPPKARAPRQLPGLPAQAPGLPAQAPGLGEPSGTPRALSAAHAAGLVAGAAGAAARGDAALQGGLRPGSKGSAASLPPLHKGPVPPQQQPLKSAWMDSSAPKEGSVPGLVPLGSGQGSLGSSERRASLQDVSPSFVGAGAGRASDRDSPGSWASSLPLPRPSLGGLTAAAQTRAGPAIARLSPLSSASFSSRTAAPGRSSLVPLQGSGGIPSSSTSSSGAKFGAAISPAHALGSAGFTEVAAPASKSPMLQGGVPFRLGDGGPCNNGSLIVTPSVHMFADPLHDSLMWDSSPCASAGEGESSLIVPLGATAPPHHFN